MSESKLIQAMEEEVGAKIAQINDEAEAKVRTVQADVDEAIADAETVARSQAEASFQSHAGFERGRIASGLRDHSRRASWELVADVLRDVERTLEQVRRREDYPSIWRRWLAEALTTYHGERDDLPALRVAAADLPLAKSRAEEFASIDVNEGLRDGLALASPDRRLRIVNTAASRLQNGRPAFTKQISDALQEPESP